MRTPKTYIDSIKQGILTDQIIAESIYSVNKRAKNCRDKAREYRQNRSHYWYYTKYNSEQKYEEQRDNYYHMKEQLLSVYQPTCIHQQHIGYKRIRVYDYEPHYEDTYKKHQKEIVWENSYLDSDDYTEVYFFDYLDKTKPQYLYFLFYQIGEFSYHTPIDKSMLKKYPELEIIRINDNFQTYGKETTGLLSVQFVRKVIQLIKSKDYTYKQSIASKPKTLGKEDEN